MFIDFWKKIKEVKLFMNVGIGGRGIGKTYSVLKGIMKEDLKFIYCRRTETELDICLTPDGNPFKTLNNDLSRDYQVEGRKKGISRIIEGEDVKGIALALSTAGKVRGVDFSDYDVLFVDEFICTSAVDRYKNDNVDLWNLIETINRNRELLGQPPIMVILCANSNKLTSSILLDLNLGEIIRKMKRDNTESYIDENRGLYFNLFNSTEISELKSQTALYKLTANTDYSRMALDNEFTDEEFKRIRQVPIKNLIPVFRFDNFTVCEVKGETYIYVTYRKFDVHTYEEKELEKLKIHYGKWLFVMDVEKEVYFYDYDLFMKFKKLFTK